MLSGPDESNLIDTGVDKGETTGRQRENKMIKLVIIVILFSSLLLVAIIVFSSKAGVVSENSYSIIYLRSGEEIFQCSNGSFSIDYIDNQNLQIAYDDSFMAYLSHSKSGKSSIDLFGCSLTNKRNVKKGGFLIDTSVSDKIILSQNGKFLAYKKKNPYSGEVSSFLYNVKKKSNKKLDLNYKDIYFFNGTDFAYLTVKNGNSLDFYKFSFSGSPELLLEDISEPKFFNKDNEQVLFIESQKGENDCFSLYIVGNDGSIELISKNAISALYDKYVIGGPLYYLTPSEKQNVSEELIVDDLKSDDEKIVEPNRKDYKFYFGYSYSFRKDYVIYEQKVRRDELRQAIARSASSGTYSFSASDCHAYIQEKKENISLIYGVSAENIVAVSNFSNFSAIIAKDYGFKGEVKKFSEFSKMLDKRELEDVVGVVLNFLDEAGSYKGLKLYTRENSEGFDFFVDENYLVDIDVNFASKSSSFFVSYELADGKRTLFEIVLSSKGLSQKKVLSNSVSVYDFSDNSAWFIDNSDDQTGELYKYQDSQVLPVLETCNYFFCLANDKVLALRNINNNQSISLADLYYIDDDAPRLIGEDVDLQLLRFKGESKIAFVKDYDEIYGGLLRIYNNEELKTISDSVSKIMVF